MKSLSSPLRRIKDMHGDTIVEVLIAIAVISFVLAGAYVMSNRSTRSMTDTQERGQALNIASTQVEFLRAANALPTGNDCFDPSGAPAAGGGGANCSYDSSGQNGCLVAAKGYCYEVQITPVSVAGNGGTLSPSITTTYKVGVTWTGLTTANDSVSLYYRVDVPNPAYVPPVDGGGGGVDGGGGGSPPGATVTPTPCPSKSDPCYVLGGTAYHYTGSFTVSTDVPDDQVASCVWDFGYTGGTKQITSPTGCRNGDHVSNYYASAPEMQNLPPWPDACGTFFKTALGNGKGLGTTYTVTVTITEKDGTKVVSKAYQIYMPACWYP